MTYISKFCKCGRILTIEQMDKQRACEYCVAHAQSLKDRLDAINKEETNDNKDNRVD